MCVFWWILQKGTSELTWNIHIILRGLSLYITKMGRKAKYVAWCRRWISMYLNIPSWLRVPHTLNSLCCDIFKWTCNHLSCWKYMQNALSFKKMYTLLGLSSQVIKLQYKKCTNISFAVVFVVKVSWHCIGLNCCLPCSCLLSMLLSTQLRFYNGF